MLSTIVAVMGVTSLAQKELEVLVKGGPPEIEKGPQARENRLQDSMGREGNASLNCGEKVLGCNGFFLNALQENGRLRT